MPAPAVADILDALAGPPGGPALAAGLRLDGLNLSPDAVRPAAEARSPPPPWWDAATDRVTVRGAALGGRSQRAAVLAAVTLEQADLAAADLAGGDLRHARLSGATFDRAFLEEADLSGAHLRFATFRGATLDSARLHAADLWGADLSAATAVRTDFREARLDEANLGKADLREAVFTAARFAHTDLRGTDLRRADLRGAVFRGARLDAADLRHADLSHLDLTGCSLAGAWLADARLDHTLLHRGQFGDILGEGVAGEFELARRGYLRLERNFLDVGDPDAASWAYRRRRRMSTRERRQRGIEAVRGGDCGRGCGYWPGMPPSSSSSWSVTTGRVCPGCWGRWPPSTSCSRGCTPSPAGCCGQ